MYDIGLCYASCGESIVKTICDRCCIEVQYVCEMTVLGESLIAVVTLDAGMSFKATSPYKCFKTASALVCGIHDVAALTSQ